MLLSFGHWISFRFFRPPLDNFELLTPYCYHRVRYVEDIQDLFSFLWCHPLVDTTSEWYRFQVIPNRNGCFACVLFSSFLALFLAWRRHARFEIASMRTREACAMIASSNQNSSTIYDVAYFDRNYKLRLFLNREKYSTYGIVQYDLDWTT